MDEAAMREIVLNGTAREIPSGCTLTELLTTLGLDPRWVVAELNGEPVPRESYARARLSDGDRLELVSPVAGG